MTDLSVALLKAGALIQLLEDHRLLNERTWTIKEDPHSPWICVDAVPFHPIDEQRPYRYAIWRRTGNLYVVGPDGAVADEPITLAEIEP